jgi:hypothetical protein
MPRALVVSVMLGSLWADPAFASQNTFDVERQAALDQVTWV